MADRLLPFDYESCDYLDDGIVQYYNAKFQEDFGPWKNGKIVETLVLDIPSGVAQEYSDSGAVVKQVKIKMVIQ